VTAAGPESPVRTRRLARWLALIAISYAALELFAFGALTLLERRFKTSYLADRAVELSQRQRQAIRHVVHDATGYTVFSAELGWTVRPGGSSSLYHANRQGLRATREYAPAPAPGVLRVAAYGDSFTHGVGVTDEDTWEARLDQLDSRVEALNFGVSAYGPGQALLRFRDTVDRFAPKVVLVGLMSENFMRSVNVFRPLYVPATGIPLAKPRFELDGTGLRLVPNPLRDADDYERLLADTDGVARRIAGHDWYWQTRYRRRPGDWSPAMRLLYVFADAFDPRAPLAGRGATLRYNERSEAFEVTARILEQFGREATERGAVPIVVMFPHVDALRQYIRHGTRIYQPMIDRLARSGLRVVDTMDDLARLREGENTGTLFQPDHAHYSAPGNEVVARTLLRYFEAQGLFDLAQPQD